MKKVVLLTGCTGLLGSFFVKQYAAIYDIIGVARRRPRSNLPLLDFIPADVCNDADKIVTHALGKHGRVDALINGAAFSQWVPLQDKPPDEFLYELQVNVVAPLALANQLLQQLWMKDGNEENRERNRSIVNISSIAAINLYENLGQGAYATTKAALNTLTKHMASEYRSYGIRVNAVAPNTFPHYVSLERVCSAIENFIEGAQNGEIRVMDQDRDYLV